MRSREFLACGAVVLCATAACGGGPLGADLPVVPAEPDFRADIVPIFNVGCGAKTMGCHARDAYEATVDLGCRGWLSLEDAALGSEIHSGPAAGQPTGCPDMDLYTRLTTLRAWQMADRPYITPGNPELSYVWNKIVGSPLGTNADGSATAPMPPIGTLSDVDRGTIRRWIEQGARR